MNFTLHQIIYTNVSSNQSPWKIGGFQTLFYPVNLIQNKEDIVEIEKRIHFPVIKDVSAKEVCFYKKINNEIVCVLLFFNYLPDEKDEYGRDGIFICHGFFLPRNIWKDYFTYSKLFPILKKHIFLSRDELLKSDFIHFESGNIEPISIQIDNVENKNLILPDSDFYIKSFYLIYKLSSNFQQYFPVLLIQGDTGLISNFLHFIMKYIPMSNKKNISWDTCFEKGNLSFFPIKIIGFKNSSPTSGEHIFIDLINQKIDATQNKHHLMKPEIPYERFISSREKSSFSPNDLEYAHCLSKALISEQYTTQWDNSSQLNDIFINVNREIIENAFQKRTTKRLGQNMTVDLQNEVNIREKLFLISTGFQSSDFAITIENTLIKIEKKPEAPKLLTEYIIAGSVRLKTMAKVWDKKLVEQHLLSILSDQKKKEMVNYWINTENIKKVWLIKNIINCNVNIDKLITSLIIQHKYNTMKLLKSGISLDYIVISTRSTHIYPPYLLKILIETDRFEEAKGVLSISPLLKKERRKLYKLIKNKSYIPFDIKNETLLLLERDSS